MLIEIRYYGFFSSLTSKMFEKTEIKEGATMAELVDKLTNRFGYKFNKLCFIRPLYSNKDYLNICINTLDLNMSKKFPDGIKTELKDGDIVSFGAIGGAA